MKNRNEIISHLTVVKNFSSRLNPLKSLKKNQSKRIYFDNVCTDSQSFLLAGLDLFLKSISKNKRKIWLLSSGVKKQDSLMNSLRGWGIEVLFLPKVDEVISGDDVLPDVDLLAERINFIEKLVSEKIKSSESDFFNISTKNFNNQKYTYPLILHDSLDEKVPSRDYFQKNKKLFKIGDVVDIDKLSKILLKSDYSKGALVSKRGEFSLRGGILDIFSWQSPNPIRIELFGNEIDSIREFDVNRQTSIGVIKQANIFIGNNEASTQNIELFEYIDDDLIVSFDLEVEKIKSLFDRFKDNNFVCFFEQIISDDLKCLFENPKNNSSEFSAVINTVGKFAPGEFILQEKKNQLFKNQLLEWLKDKWSVIIFFNTEGEKERFYEIFSPFIKEHEELKNLIVLIGELKSGFTISEAKLVILTDSELFGRYQGNLGRRMDKLFQHRESISGLVEVSALNYGDLVVHRDFGIALYLGIEERALDPSYPDVKREVIVLEFSKSSKLFVPIERVHLITKYLGGGNSKTVKLSTLGDSRWKSKKQVVEGSIMKYAEKLLKVQAIRNALRGITHKADTKWGEEFEHSFIYKETKDQITAIEDTKNDMEDVRPMDRLICGDVGFGKTEVAIRAAFKAVMGGFQVAFLAPTTVLAKQHFMTLKERMSDYPIKIEVLNRFVKGKDSNNIVKGISKGTSDIVIGTHRLISKDIVFKNLGLVIVDEEQRFGVAHKEKLKEKFNLVDVLTLSATPIPRTLYMSLVGVRDMSQISTPPINRLPVQTRVCAYNDKIIRDSINKEISRDGQVFFLHNRIISIEKMCDKIRKLCPKAKVLFAHGQMDKYELEAIMGKFISGKINVLVSTTIIESGIDIPNANTIIIDRADRFGLADLYQLRGRVGRSGIQAYAILLLPNELIVGSDAQKRVNAIREHNKLGEGFKIAMQDLEIRGAGNVLGTQQSGHMMTIGFELYCQLLKQAVNKIKGGKLINFVNVSFDADCIRLNESDLNSEKIASAFIPSSYISHYKFRLEAYRMLAEITDEENLENLKKSWRDRFGKIPDETKNLLLLNKIKILCSKNNISSLKIKDQKIMLMRNNNYIQVNGKFPRIDYRHGNNILKKLLELIISL